jgi:hypothetical protein
MIVEMAWQALVAPLGEDYNEVLPNNPSALVQPLAFSKGDSSKVPAQRLG